jgi:hypothetical protein
VLKIDFWAVIWGFQLILPISIQARGNYALRRIIMIIIIIIIIIIKEEWSSSNV